MNDSSKPVQVSWLADAKRDLPLELRDQISDELLVAFGSSTMNATRSEATSSFNDNGLRTIIVKQRLSGFEDNPQKKLILGIEVQFAGRTHSNVVKIGKASEVSRDYTAWQACAAKRNVTSRLFIAPWMENVGIGRVVVVYPDVYQFYLSDSDLRNEVGPKDLEAIVKLSIESNHPTADSVERVITQVYTEAHRCFYRHAREATSDESILHAIKRSLRIGEPNDILTRWEDPSFIKLRRGADWMTNANRMPDAKTRPEYIDPVDYVCWVCERGIGFQPVKTNPQAGSLCHNGKIPKMLVGPAHGDLHGRNIIVGVVRDQAEWPAVFDFDKMDNDNLVAWDFAKLELELKCRVFHELLDTPDERRELRKLLNLDEKRPIPSRVKLSGDEQRVADRIERMEIMFGIERLLLDWTKRLSSQSQAIGHDQEFMESIPDDTPIGRALRIIFRIRREAAMVLGFARQGRESAWIDEYLFAVVVYGVTSLKWHSANEHLAWKMIAAGVAAAGMSTFAWTGNVPERGDIDSSLSYFPTLFHAYKSWKANKSADSVAKLRTAMQRYPYSVALRQQLALALLESEDDSDQSAAQQEIELLGNLPIVFRDHEILSRLGRIFKNRGDAACDCNIPLSEVIRERLAAYQYYSSARDYYRDGFELSGAYYPGVNAATLSLMVGDKPEQERIARAVLDICKSASFNSPDRLWILASAGEASLLIDRADKAADFYRNALQAVAPSDVGTVQSMYDQLCRLHWALAGKVTQSTIAVFQADPRFPLLEPGPCTNCDL